MVVNAGSVWGLAEGAATVMAEKGGLFAAAAVVVGDVEAPFARHVRGLDLDRRLALHEEVENRPQFLRAGQVSQATKSA